MKRVVVVGSGLAGLSAGYRLREQGWQVTVFESLGRVGGRVLSESEDGFVFDVGPVIVTDKYTEYMKLVREVGLSDQVVDCKPEMGVVKGNELHILDTEQHDDVAAVLGREGRGPGECRFAVFGWVCLPGAPLRYSDVLTTRG